MAQKPTVLYLRMKRMALDAIHDDLVHTLGEDAVAYSAVTKYARSAHFSRRKGATPPEAPDVGRSSIDEAILTALAEFSFPFSSVRELSRRICLPRSTVHPHRHLTQSLHFTVRSLSSSVFSVIIHFLWQMRLHSGRFAFFSQINRSPSKRGSLNESLWFLGGEREDDLPAWILNRKNVPYWRITNLLEVE
jgi:hypothetical protein